MKVFEQLERRRQWSSDERIVLDQVRRLANEAIAPNADRFDRSGEFPWANMEAINNLGLNGVVIPEAYGGAPMSYRLFVNIVRTLAEACASTANIYSATLHSMFPIIEYGTEEQKARFLPIIANGAVGAIAITEPGAGSAATEMTTQFRPNGGDIVIQGTKTFITSGDVAELILVFGKWTEIKDSKKSLSVLVYEKGTPGFEVLRHEDKMGHRASSTVALGFNECRVPATNLVGNPGDGLKILRTALNKSRPSIAAGALGIATAAFKDMIGYMNERRQSGQRIIDFQGNQFMIADLAAEFATTDWWLDYVARLVDDGVEDFAVEASMAKMRASDFAMRVTTEAVQMYGGYGYCRDYRVERLMRDAKVTQIWEGTNQIHRQIIGRSFARR